MFFGCCLRTGAGRIPWTRRGLFGAALSALLLFFAGGLVAAPPKPVWPTMREDGVHDPRSPVLKELQEPAAALSELAAQAPDPTIGNQVRWVHAIEKGLIAPRSALWEATPVRVLDLDIYLSIGGSMPVVRFPHQAHTYWLDCSNCHEHLFVAKAGANKIAMYQILEGEQCGVCHGAVAFPLTECKRCHSVTQQEFGAIEQALGLVRIPGTKVAVPPSANSAKALRGKGRP